MEDYTVRVRGSVLRRARTSTRGSRQQGGAWAVTECARLHGGTCIRMGHRIRYPFLNVGSQI
eukprot:480001-Prymnesium_polylepis.2